MEVEHSDKTYTQTHLLDLVSIIYTRVSATSLFLTDDAQGEGEQVNDGVKQLNVLLRLATKHSVDQDGWVETHTHTQGLCVNTAFSKIHSTCGAGTESTAESEQHGDGKYN